MKKLTITKSLLWVVTALGGYLVTQGIVTGEELSSLTNIIGLIMAGGGITANGVIYILSNIPTTLVSKGYDKAVEVYGATKVDNILNQFDEIKEVVKTFIEKVDEFNEQIGLERDIKNELGVYENLTDELKDRL